MTADLPTSRVSFWQEPPPAPWSPGRHAFELVAVFLAGVAVLAFLYDGAGGVNGEYVAVPGFDSFYHTKMAMLLPEIGLIHKFPWLTTTIFADKFVSHHYGFHLLLLPFLKASQWFGADDPLQGARWAMCFCFGLVAVLFDLLLIAGRVRFRPFWWLMFLLLPVQFFGRHVFIRAMCPSLVFQLVLVLAMFRRRYVLSGLVVFLFTQLYLGSVTYSPLLVVAYFLGGLLGRPGERVSWKLPAWTLGGWLLGIAVHPYGGWDALEFLRLQVLGTGLDPDIAVGREWKSYTPAWFFVEMSAATLVLLVASIGARMRCGERLDAKEFALLLVNFAYLGLTLKARRFIEYWPIFSVLCSAYLCAPLLRREIAGEPGDREPGSRFPGTALGTVAVVFFAGTAAATIAVASRLGVGNFVAEWRLWSLLLAALAVAAVPCHRVGGQQPWWAPAAVGLGTVGLVLGVGAAAFWRRELPAARFPAEWWLWVVLAGAYVLNERARSRVVAAGPLPYDRGSDGGRFSDSGPDPRSPRRIGSTIAAVVTRSAGGAGLGLAALLFAAGPLVSVQTSSRCGFDLAAVREVMDYLEAHSAPGEIVFTDDWDVFGLFFYHNHRNRYIVGLDPKFTHARDPALWDRYTHITQAKTPASVETETVGDDGRRRRERITVSLADIRTYFDADWVIVDENHQSFARKLIADPTVAELVYRTTQETKDGTPRYQVFRVRSKEE